MAQWITLEVLFTIVFVGALYIGVANAEGIKRVFHTVKVTVDQIMEDINGFFERRVH